MILGVAATSGTLIPAGASSRKVLTHRACLRGGHSDDAGRCRRLLLCRQVERKDGRERKTIGVACSSASPRACSRPAGTWDLPSARQLRSAPRRWVFRQPPLPMRSGRSSPSPCSCAMPDSRCTCCERIAPRSIPRRYGPQCALAVSMGVMWMAGIGLYGAGARTLGRPGTFARLGHPHVQHGPGGQHLRSGDRRMDRRPPPPNASLATAWRCWWSP